MVRAARLARPLRRGREVVTPAIRADGLTKRLGERLAVDGVTFEVDRGEIFGFLGPNGAGKTTTVRLLGTLLRPSAGTAAVAGIPVTPDNGQEIRTRISVMPETPGLHLRLTTQENLEYHAGLYGFRGREAARRVRAALDAVGLQDRRRDLAGALSKGLRQRAALARTLLNDPEVLFLDEPTEGLDPQATQDVRELISSIRSRGTTIFLTTHRLDEAERLCDRVAILRTRLLAVGKLDELRAQWFTSAIEVRLTSPLTDPEAVLRKVPGLRRWERRDGRYRLEVQDPERAAPALARALVAAGADILELGEVEHPLEEVYLSIVKDRK